MTGLVPASDRRPILAIIDDAPKADSRDIANFFQKNHRDVLRSIDNLLSAQPSLALRSFAQGSYTLTETGKQEHRCFLVDRDGFSLLAMGFTGVTALGWKLAYIAAFNAMEAELRARTSTRIDVRDPAQLAAIAIQLVEVNRELTERVETAERAVAIAAPKAEFYDRFADADGLYGLQNAARALGQPPQAFIDDLKKEFLFYQGGKLVPRSQFAQRGLFVVKPVLNGETARHQTFVTAKGLQWLAGRLPRRADLFAEALIPH